MNNSGGPQILLRRLLSQTRVGIVRWSRRPGWNVDFGVELVRKGGRLARELPDAQFADNDVFWQAVFLSFFAPEHVSRMSFCEWCGQPLESQIVKLCNICRMRESLAKDTGEFRKYERERKGAERAELRKVMGKRR